MLDIFITGAGKNSGKTFITAGLAATMQSLSYDTGVYVPVQTGAFEKDGYVRAPDLVFVKNMDENIKTYCSYLFKANDLPLIAAAKANQTIERNVILEDFHSIRNRFECMLIGGTNGIATPLGADFLELDLIKALKVPFLLIVSPYTSTISDVLALINHAKSQKAEIRGVIINDCPYNTEDENIRNFPKLIEKYTDTRVLGVIPHIEDLENLNPNDLIGYILAGVDLERVFNIKIAKLNM